ncbi:MAG: twin-arginine translocase TatA/TatE family subunit [Chloroflexota bacterium]|nr:twin-arginine translocase TatA/TatE family subunit [Chloroflexota bacterium]
MPFGFHGLDLVVIMVIALLIFGPKRLPEMGNAIGKSISSFKRGMNELTAPKDEKPETYEVVPNQVVTPTYSAPTPEIVPEPSTPEVVHEEVVSETESRVK